MVDACYYNEITCADVPDITFTINVDNSSPGADTSQPMLSCTQTAVDNAGTSIACPLEQTLQTYDTGTSAWISNTG